MHLLNLLPPLLPVLLRLYECCNTKSIVGSLFFFCIRGEVRVVQVGPPPLPALHLAFLAPTLF